MDEIKAQKLTKTREWIEIKEFLKSELIDKPMNIKTDYPIDRIALEVRASQLAIEKVLKAIKKFERLGSKQEIVSESWK